MKTRDMAGEKSRTLTNGPTIRRLDVSAEEATCDV